jgi:hypothetical protein
MHRRRAERYRRFSPSSSVLLLPQVGPFASLGQFVATSQPDITYASLTRPVSSRTSPIIKNTITVNSGVSLAPALTGSTRYAIFIWANKLILNGTINMSGDVGGNGDPFTVVAGTGGSGGSGGGGGAGDSGGGASTFPGGDGGSGSTGGGGNGDTAGLGGSGFGNTYNSGFASYGSGGNGANSSDGMAFGSAGGNGFGGAGGGGYCDSTVGGAYAGAGAGGGGLAVAVTNWLTRTIAAGQFLAKGAAGGVGDGFGFSGNGGPSGGGCVYVACKRYDGNLTAADVSAGGGSATAGTVKLFEITVGNTLVAHTLWTDSWNNL